MQIGVHIRQPLSPQPDIRSVGAEGDAFYEQLHDACLLGGE
jgi:hypothetical protein